MDGYLPVYKIMSSQPLLAKGKITMAILDKFKKKTFMMKTALGYVTYYFETLASIVKMADGRNVEDCINELNRNSLGFPDWNNQKLLPVSEVSHLGTATMTSKGYVYVGIRSSQDRRIQLSVNGKTVAAIYSHAAATGITPLIPVKPGDTVTFNLDVGNAGGTAYQTFRYFVPAINP